MKALVIVLGVVILAMMGALVVGLAHRMHPAPPPIAASLLLDEPAGTHILSIAATGRFLAVLLQGGGPDRVVLLDPEHGRIAGRVGLRP